MAEIRIGIAGADGRMGRTVEALARADPAFEVTARMARGAAPAAEGLGLCDVVVDFSAPGASAALAAAAALRAAPALVVGTTGFAPQEEAAIAAAARKVAIVKSGNFSLGVNLLALLVEDAARRLGPEAWDARILDIHHRGKRDAPSGTALMLGEAVARGRGAQLRDGVAYAALRAGGIVGEHSVMFAAEDETITLSHSAKDRSLFARGALAAARWAVSAPGLYDMRDVLGGADLTAPR